MRAAAYCVTTHSNRFGDQMPTRSPACDADRQERPRDLGRLRHSCAVRGPVALRANDEGVAIGHALYGPRQIGADGLAEERHGARAVRVQQHGRLAEDTPGRSGQQLLGEPLSPSTAAGKRNSDHGRVADCR